MQVEIDGEVLEVGSGRDALASVAPHQQVVVSHRRADGAVLQLIGSSAHGFGVEVEGGHTGRRSSANRAMAATTVATMLDRFAARDTGWPGAVIWRDEATGAVRSTRPSRARRALAVVAGLVVAAVAVSILRSAVTVPWLCGRDGRDVESVRIAGDGLRIGRRAQECTFTDGSVVAASDLGAGYVWAEVIATALAAIVIWYVVARLVQRVLTR
jgi:hypothetical protein